MPTARIAALLALLAPGCGGSKNTPMCELGPTFFNLQIGTYHGAAPMTSIQATGACQPSWCCPGPDADSCVCLSRDQEVCFGLPPATATSTAPPACTSGAVALTGAGRCHVEVTSAAGDVRSWDLTLARQPNPCGMKLFAPREVPDLAVVADFHPDETFGPYDPAICAGPVAITPAGAVRARAVAAGGALAVDRDRTCRASDAVVLRVTVSLRDRAGGPRAGVRLSFETTTGSSVTPAAATTDAQGDIALEWRTSNFGVGGTVPLSVCGLEPACVGVLGVALRAAH